jgi:1,4-alpha-glucan branching enzyme
MREIRHRLQRILEKDPYLTPYKDKIYKRLLHIENRTNQLTKGTTALANWATAHEYFGLHHCGDEWVFREWAPNATALFLLNQKNKWKAHKQFALTKITEEGIWEIYLPADLMQHKDLYRLQIQWAEGYGDRIPAYTRRVVQDPHTLIFNAQVWKPANQFGWKHPHSVHSKYAPLIYEAHIGMAQEEPKIGSYNEFTHHILPRIIDAGYNTVQLMAIPEHPYYGSFGYQVSSFFAPSSRFGTPTDLKNLIDKAHALGLAVIMDIIHSHAAANEVEGLSRFDGTRYQYFHSGQRGLHQTWGSRCFNYGKARVLQFLLSNCRYWLDEFRFDGFRFDGITSMIYLHHGLNRTFHSYNQYFDETIDVDALTYLALANQVIHSIRPDAITIAEDVSGMPGLAAPQKNGGYGFNYRFAMGIPDYWIKLVKEVKDEDWPVGNLWFELTNRRDDEKTISYTESHDQALVGDQSLIFRMIGSTMYDHMNRNDTNDEVARGIALHKLIRLITFATAGHGYLNFMGNEFGHPDWIDFPRPGNNWSFQHARRQWHLRDDATLKYSFLARFDQDMIQLTKNHNLFSQTGLQLLHEHSERMIIAFKRSNLIFAFNFHPTQSYPHYRIDAPPGKYLMILNSDALTYGGFNRLSPHQTHFTIVSEEKDHSQHQLSLYLPSRSAIVLFSDVISKQNSNARVSK